MRPILPDCKRTVWDGNPAPVLIYMGTVYYRAWIVSERQNCHKTRDEAIHFMVADRAEMFPP